MDGNDNEWKRVTAIQKNVKKKFFSSRLAAPQEILCFVEAAETFFRGVSRWPEWKLGLKPSINEDMFDLYNRVTVI